MKILCSEWASQVSHINCSIWCHYMEPQNKHKLHPCPAKRRKPLSVKANFNCPFCIRHSLPGLIKQSDDPAWKPCIMHKVCSVICNSSCLSTNPINLLICFLLFLYCTPVQLKITSMNLDHTWLFLKPCIEISLHLPPPHVLSNYFQLSIACVSDYLHLFLPLPLQLFAI